jgi:hypothetical protein
MLVYDAHLAHIFIRNFTPFWMNFNDNSIYKLNVLHVYIIVAT